MSTTSRIKAAMLFQLLLIALLALVITGETGVSEGDFWLLAAAGLLALATLPILLYAQNEVLAHNEEDINLDIPIHTPPSINPEAEKEAIIQQITKDLGYSFQNIVDALVKGETEQAKRLAQPQVFAAGVDQLAALVQQLQDRRRQDQKHLGLMHFMTRALDKIDAKVMIADHDLNILYTNQAVRQLLQDREANIRQQLPNFNARKLVGTNIDVFHANPQHQRQLLAQLQDRHQAKINVGGCTFSFCVNALYNKQDERMGFVVEWHDLTDQLASQEREQAQQKALEKVTQENTRIRFALDKVSTNIMIADEQYDIIYINQAVQNMFAKCADQLRQVIPHFDAHHLIGVNIDSFHKHPQHQRQMLAALRDTYKTQIQLAGRSFRLIANPIINSEQQRCGTVVEWADVTNEVAAEQEIADIVIQAAAGDFSGRIQLEGKEGFFLQLGQSLNRLLEITSEGLEDVAEVLSAIAEGDLTHRIDREYQGTFLRLKEDTNQTVEQLCRIVGQIKESTDAINTAASEIAAGNNDLSQRTEEQASSLQETAASMEQITSTVQQNADNARQANQLAIGASDVAERGGQVVNDVVKTMQMITSSSRQIEEIITVIDSIAFQTNILALNAAVEAARAGEQGRGFAVVATEVRNLARRSADAAKEIKALINKSVETVESGSHLVTDAGHTMSEIVTAVKRVTDIMAEISAASDEQRSGIEQINLAITQLDEVTQQNAALVEEAAAASEAAEEQARNLSEAIAFFRVDENAQVRAPLALQAPPGHQPHKTHAAVPSTPVKTPPLPAPRKEMDADEGWEEF